MEKAEASNYEGRFNEIISDPCNLRIPRVPDAGVVEDDVITMHNGIKISMGNFAYYGNFSEILKLNKGVHEPQEEYVFGEVLKYINPGSTMIELGAYWGFYSLWFQNKVPGAINYLIEPDPDNLLVGIKNFEINNMHGDFTNGRIGEGGLDLNLFFRQKNINRIGILHADIQGDELNMIMEINPLLKAQMIDYIFVSTHSQSLHYSCIDALIEVGYTIIASADFDFETFCFDGVLIAKRKELIQPNFVELPLRDPQRVTSKIYIENKLNSGL